MASPSLPYLLASSLLLFPLLAPATSSTLNPNNEQSICHFTPYPASCLESQKFTISISISIPTNPSTLTSAICSLQAAISYGTKLSSLLCSIAPGPNLVESQKGSLQDCRDLHQISLSSLKNSMDALTSSADGSSFDLADVRAYLSAALTNNATCLEGLAGARGSLKPSLMASWSTAYEHVSNSLHLVTHLGPRRPGGRRRRLLSSAAGSDGFPSWVSRRNRRLLQSDDDEGDGGDYGEYNPSSVVTVAADGTGNFTTVGEAVAFAPNNSADRIVVLVRAGVYEENVEIPSEKPNIVLIGDGSDVTVIRGNRSVGDGWTTFRSATVAVSGQGFLARDITFQNTAGPAKYQAVALRVNADLVAVYRCIIDGYQDSLYVHSFRQFYRECDIYGTVDFIFGNAAVIFQGCNIVAKNPLPGQYNVIAAQFRDDPNEDTGISIQNCSVLASNELASSNVSTKTYLGRPLRLYSRTVSIESYLGGLVDPAGWTEYLMGGQGLDTLYFGEYMNSGPGSGTDGRITWPGYHIMDYDDASNFTVSEFIYGDEWLGSTSFPYDDGV